MPPFQQKLRELNAILPDLIHISWDVYLRRVIRRVENFLETSEFYGSAKNAAAELENAFANAKEARTQSAERYASRVSQLLADLAVSGLT